MVNRPTPPAPRRPLITDLDASGRKPARNPSDRTNARPALTKSNRGRTIRNRVIAVVVVLVVVAVGYIGVNYASFISGITHVNAIVGGTSADKDQNILLVGDDHRPAGASAQELAELGTTQDGGSLDTDTIMLLHVPADGANPTIISFPRDSWVNIPGFGMHKINSAFAFGAAKGGASGGAQLLIKVVQNLTGLTVDHFVRISLLGFYTVVKALGPVTVCLKQAANDSFSGVHLPAGYSSLNAQQALAFVRQRHGLPDGDLDREIRQQYFLSIEAHQILTAGTLLNPVKLHNVTTAVSSSIETDPGLNLLDLAAQVKGFGGRLRSTTIPITGTPTIVVNGTPVSIVAINTAAIPAFIHAIVHPKTSTGSTATSPAPSTITVTVYNGGGVGGAAASASTALGNIGFKTGTPQTATIQSTTTVNYPAADAAAAAVVAKYLPGAKLVATSGISGVQVVLGTDHIAVNAKAPSSTTTTPAKAATNTYTAASCVN